MDIAEQRHSPATPARLFSKNLSVRNLHRRRINEIWECDTPNILPSVDKSLFHPLKEIFLSLFLRSVMLYCRKGVIVKCSVEPAKK